jgi:predicted RND superfamily exporter protein
MIGRFNLISVAFAALFIGLGVDFGIQFATRYREERHNDDDLERSLLSATRGIGSSLTLAAVSLLAGFFCFLPTSFSGVRTDSSRRRHDCRLHRDSRFAGGG